MSISGLINESVTPRERRFAATFGDILTPPITILRISRGEDRLSNFPGARFERVVRAPAD